MKLNKIEIKQQVDSMVHSLQIHGNRITPQRMAILKILSSSKEHPTVEQIYNAVVDEFPMTSLATVYKTVALLKEIGLVVEMSGLNNNSSSRYDGTSSDPHPHFVCMSCGDIFDLEKYYYGEVSELVEKKTGFKILDRNLTFKGYCLKCQNPDNQGEIHDAPGN